MVLDPDSETDTMDHTYGEVVLSGSIQVCDRDKDIQQLLLEYEDIMTKEPGLTKLISFAIDTGDHRPIAQRPYNTPLALRESVDKELDWLLAQGYI